jgi:hypothetical protein
VIVSRGTLGIGALSRLLLNGSGKTLPLDAVEGCANVDG